MAAARWAQVLKSAKEERSAQQNKQKHEDGNSQYNESYFDKNFGMRNSALQALIQRLMCGGSETLNKEQQRAFHIIANHASLPKQKQLLMYLGGMGGTGKTRVVNTVMTFFTEREEGQ
ncbi:hypothetical protein GYMLUDRAFT_250196 [Collybiopsis luxurians FD-317 M1]|uniref:Uncharacterized protein n=1 Tax=Collybiopsis luxurians FD-317 M1 TaxID=944289 RepID=A0A0D0C6W8_9AGAR|nr:hypothetical protein GYMLUDRAFT_250196 [Collybiopsis luxurians FD-317 M1]